MLGFQTLRLYFNPARWFCRQLRIGYLYVATYCEKLGRLGGNLITSDSFALLALEFHLCGWEGANSNGRVNTRRAGVCVCWKGSQQREHTTTFHSPVELDAAVRLQELTSEPLQARRNNRHKQDNWHKRCADLRKLQKVGSRIWQRIEAGLRWQGA